MAAEPRSSELPDGPRTAAGRATPGHVAADRTTGRDRRDAPRIAYRCGACGERFVPPEPGPAPCPRCQSIGDHDALGRVGGDAE